MKQKDLADLLGITPAMVSKLAKRGMPTDTLERAERWRRRHLELPRTKGALPSAARANDGAGSDSEEDDRPSPDDDSADYRLARARREGIRAEREQIELDKLRGSLISVEEIERIEFTSSRVIRDRLQAVPARLTLRLVGMARSGAEAHEIECALDKEIEQILRETCSALEILAQEEEERTHGTD